MCLSGHARHHEQGLERRGAYVCQVRTHLQFCLDRNLSHLEHRCHQDPAENLLNQVLSSFYSMLKILECIIICILFFWSQQYIIFTSFHSLISFEEALWIIACNAYDCRVRNDYKVAFCEILLLSKTFDGVAKILSFDQYYVVALRKRSF